MPIFCSSLALEFDGVAEIAAVYDPSRRELFTAVRGAGAFLNGQPIRVSSAATLIDAMLVTGFPYDVHTRLDEIIGLFRAFVGQARAVRRLGSAAIDLCYVAAGRMDGFWERDLSPWDIAGGALLVTEAGGRVTGLHGEVVHVAWTQRPGQQQSHPRRHASDRPECRINRTSVLQPRQRRVVQPEICSISRTRCGIGPARASGQRGALI